MNYKYTRANNFKLEQILSVQYTGPLDMPIIHATQAVPQRIIPFNELSKCNNPQDYFVHFYLDDYQFERVWDNPRRYTEVLAKYAGVIGTDYSMYLDMPTAQQIYNNWRNKLLMAYWQSQGITVIPNARWSSVGSYDWCFDGLPERSTVAVSSIGCENAHASLHFVDGYKEMLHRLSPTKIVFVGNILPELEGFGDVINFCETKLNKLKTR